MSEYNNEYSDVIAFWFEELQPQQWWQKDDALDKLIADRFGTLQRAAAACELSGWRNSASGRLAEIIALDQFSRNIFRDRPESFACDPLALALAQEEIALKMNESLSAVERSFLYMPFMHSESALIHEQAVSLFKANGIDSNYEFELKHKVIIDRFGRYPHRNAILGRESTPDEIAFLEQPGSSF